MSRFNEKYVHWSDKKFKDQHQFICHLFEMIDFRNIFNFGRVITIKRIDYEGYHKRYINNENLKELSIELADDVKNLHDYYDFGLFPLELQSDVESMIKYSDEIVKEFGIRHHRKQDRKLYDLIESIDCNINDITSILAKYKPVLNHIRQMNKSN